MNNKVSAICTMLLCLFAFAYSANSNMMIQIVSFVFITIGVEFVSVYYKNERTIYECLESFNEKYYDMYVKHITMSTKLAFLCFGISFSTIYQILCNILKYENPIGNILVPFIFSFLLSTITVILVLLKFNTCKFNKVFIEISKKRQKDFISDFTTEEKEKILKQVITNGN